MKAQQTLYDKVVEITSELLGPASERFVARQVHSHLNKKPADMTPTDLRELVDWLKLSVSLLTEDTETVNDYARQLLALTKK